MNNFTYQIPKDKEQLIYDFYAVTNLSGGMLPGFPEPLHSSFRRHEETLDFIREEIMNQLCDYLIVELKDAVLFAVSAEFRHLHDENTQAILREWAQKNKILSFYVRYHGMCPISEMGRFNEEAKNYYRDKYLPSTKKNHSKDFFPYVASYNSVKLSGASPQKFFKIAEKAFMELRWEEGFGGESWAEIAKSGYLLYNLKKDDELMKKITIIDYIYHLQHNTNTVFNKLNSYYKNAYEWILEGLNFRANLENFYLLIGKCSSGLKPFLYALIHDMYGVSKEKFDNDRKNIFERYVEKWNNDGGLNVDEMEFVEGYLKDYDPSEKFLDILVQFVAKNERLPTFAIEWMDRQIVLPLESQRFKQVPIIKNVFFLQRGDYTGYPLMKSMLETHEPARWIQKICDIMQKGYHLEFADEWFIKNLKSESMNNELLKHIADMLRTLGFVDFGSPISSIIRWRFRSNAPDEWVEAMLDFCSKNDETNFISAWGREELMKSTPHLSLVKRINHDIVNNGKCFDFATPFVVNKILKGDSPLWMKKIVDLINNDEIYGNSLIHSVLNSITLRMETPPVLFNAVVDYIVNKFRSGEITEINELDNPSMYNRSIINLYKSSNAIWQAVELKRKNTSW